MADTKRNRLLFWGGGHNDYSGNEVYSLDLTRVGLCTSSNPCMTRLDNFSPAAANSGQSVEQIPCTTGSGLNCPTARHTYDELTYVTSKDVMFSVGGGLNYNGGGFGVWELSLSSVPQSCAPTCTPIWTRDTDYHEANYGYTTVYDPVHNRTFVSDSTYLYYYDFGKSTWTRAGTASYGDYNGTAIYDDHDQYMIRIGCYSTCGIHYWSLATGSSYKMNSPAIDSSCTTAVGSYTGFAWDPLARLAVIYPGSGNTIWLLDPSTWKCTTETYGSTIGVDYPPNMNSGMAVFGKHFSYFPAMDIFTACNDYANNCWYLRRRRGNARSTTVFPSGSSGESKRH